ncbi:MAG: hypothetical protein WDO71_04625 [Bacteroidota bacterium]
MAKSRCNAAVYVNDLASLTVAHFNGTNWDSHGNGGGTTGNGVAGTVTRNSVSAFGTFTLGSTSAAFNPLPVRFGDINGFIKGTGVQLTGRFIPKKMYIITKLNVLPTNFF